MPHPNPRMINNSADPFAIDFDHRPHGVEPLASEPDFNPSRHLALEKPGEIISLQDFGYSIYFRHLRG